MAFHIRYRPACTVTVRHGYHLNDALTDFEDLDEATQRRLLATYDVWDDLRLVVPEDTRRRMAGLGMLVKRFPTGFGVYVSVREPAPGTFVPERTPVEPLRLRFALAARAPYWWNYTNVALDQAKPTLFHVSNEAGQLGGTFPYLARPARVYASGTVYAPGDVVRHGPGATVHWLSLRRGAHPQPLSDDPNWFRLGQHYYLTEQDRAALRDHRFPFVFPPGVVAEARFVLAPLDGPGVVVGQAEAAPGETLVSAVVDGSALPAGRYVLQVTGLAVGGDPWEHEEALYLDSALRGQRIVAVVDLAHRPGTDLGDFSLFDEAAGYRLREPEVVLPLLNRYTYWHYAFRTPLPSGTDLGDLEDVDGQLVTRAAMPLTRSFAEVAYDGGTLLPNPSPAMIRPEADRVFSDVYLHTHP